MNNITTLEDLLEAAANLRNTPKIMLDKEDMTIMHSIARQAYKGTPLTDRQQALMQQKLQNYKEQFVNLDIDFDFAIGQLRQPLRQIDRSKYIKIKDGRIKIRFPFRKLDIISVQKCAFLCDDSEYSHKQGSHEHEFDLTEQNILNLLDEFSEKNFEIDESLIKLYKEIKEIQSKPENYVTGIFNNNVINANKKLQDIINQENADTILKLIDRRFRYGLEYKVDFNPLSYAENIAARKDIFFHSKPSAVRLGDVLNSLDYLDRYPILVILDKENAEDQLHSIVTHFRDLIDVKHQSVLFRVDWDDTFNPGFNQLVKDRKLNNWVDKDTKIVYISKDKLPKLLVRDDWKPQTCFSFTSNIDRIVNTYINFHCDLVLWREEEVSPFRKHSRLYG